MVKLHTFVLEIRSTAGMTFFFGLQLKPRLKLQFQSRISKSLDLPLTVIENFPQPETPCENF